MFVQFFFFEQYLGHFFELTAFVGEDLFGIRVAGSDDFLSLVVDHLLEFFRVLPDAGPLTQKQILLMVDQRYVRRLLASYRRP